MFIGLSISGVTPVELRLLDEFPARDAKASRRPGLSFCLVVGCRHETPELPHGDGRCAKIKVARQDNGWFAFKKDFYTVQIGDTKARSFVLSLAPIKWRFFYARIGSPELG